MDRRQTEAALRVLGESADEDIELAEAALLLALLGRPRVSLDRYRAHIHVLIEDARAALARTHDKSDGLSARIAAIREAIYVRHGYAGDEATYDDLQNANLMRVIDRRKGMPIALGVLYMCTARGLGLDAYGVNFPAHFLIQLDFCGERALIDPFSQGQRCTSAELRALIKKVLGPDAELSRRFYSAMTDREVLLRLQNNIKFRLIQEGRFDEAARVVGSMLLIAPVKPELWHEDGVLNARLGRPGAAIRALETFLDLCRDEHPERHRATALLHDLKTKLN
ncbi:MAG: transglutaminase-like domain-containing protein [Alphaproteobacteria bacterium]|nr:transglutaminase-like domain-containing protein [Alphaproteobacteria bacterium]